MRIDPAIATLAREPTVQRRARAASAGAGNAWRGATGTARVLAEFGRYGDGAPLALCPALLAAFTDRRSAPQLVAALVRELCLALAAEPFAHPPFRHGYDRGSATLLLARSGRAQLVLHSREPGCHRFDTVAFGDGERREAVLAGRARARIVLRQGRAGRLAAQTLALGCGVRLALDLREQALQVLAIDRRLVSLWLHRSARKPGPSCEYDIASGALLRRAAGDIRVSRHEMMLAVLGRMGRSEAAPVMAAIAREPGDESLRWQALRECLALDTAAGFAALGDLARDAADALAAPARALQARLLVAKPDLRELVDRPCPA